MSFPPEAKTCLHCGGRLGKPALSRGGDAGPMLGSESVFEPAEEESMPRAGGLRMGMGGLWVVVAVIITILRSCGEG